MKEKEIRALIERRRKEWRYGSSIEAKYRAEECDDILELMGEQEEPVSEELISVAKQYIDSHVFGNEEDKFTRSVLVDMFCSGAKWQKAHNWKPADGDDLPEYEREVVVFTQDFPNDAGIMMVAIGHRPTPEGFDGRSLTTGKVEHYTPKTYDKGGWNIPNVVLWLDLDIPQL